jgi:acetoin utilization protein AcuB
MTVRSLMSTDLVWASPDDDVRTAALRMRRCKVRHLPVLDEERRLMGVLSDRDIARNLPSPILGLEAEHDVVLALPVSAIMMRGSVLAVSPATSLREAMELMLANRISALPVIDGRERAVGMLSVVDCVNRLREYVSSAADHPMPPAATSHVHRWTVGGARRGRRTDP